MRDTGSLKRRLAVAGTTMACVLVVAVPAAAQTGGSGPPGSTTTTSPSSPSPAPVGPPGRATLRKDGTAVAPSNAPPAIQAALAAGNAIHTHPDPWAGGRRTFYPTRHHCRGAGSH